MVHIQVLISGRKRPIVIDITSVHTAKIVARQALIEGVWVMVGDMEILYPPNKIERIEIVKEVPSD